MEKCFLSKLGFSSCQYKHSLEIHCRSVGLKQSFICEDFDEARFINQVKLSGNFHIQVRIVSNSDKY